MPEVQRRDAPGCSGRMAELRRQFPTVAGIGAIAPDGVQFCSSAGDVAGTSLADRPFFSKPRATGRWRSA
jgi:hypothetical protein